MNPTYTFIGGDGRQYGPHPLETIQSWIGEGRLMPDTQMARSDAEGWFRAGDFKEFNWAGSTGAVGAPATTTTPVVATPGVARPVPTIAPVPVAGVSADAAAMAGVRSRASWFYWIAALTAVNVGMALGGSATRFVVGTALAEVFMAMGQAAGAQAVGVVLSALLIGAFVLFGAFGGKAHRWAFIIGLLVYAGDAVLCLLLAAEWLSLAFHAWAIWRLVEGLRIAWAVQTARHR